MNDVELNVELKKIELLKIIAECQIYSIWDGQSSRAASLLEKLREMEEE